MVTTAPSYHLSVKVRPLGIVVNPGDGDVVRVPAGIEFASAQFVRHGGDLELILTDGRHVTLRGYFDTDGRPLVGAGGEMLPAELVQALAGPLAPAQYAQAGGGVDSSLVQIGVVDRLAGTVKVRHADGSSATLGKGEIVYQGDVIETEGQGAVGVIFADRSTFSLGSGARMVLDEMIYSPDTQSGSAAISVTHGSFSFISGQLAKSSPDAMVVRTPVMTIGIRGTTVAGQVRGGGQTEVVLLQDSGGAVGEITLSNSSGTQTLNQPNTLVGVTSAFAAFSAPLVVPASVVNERFGQAVSNLPPPPTQGSMEWNTTPGQAEQAPVEQIQQREGANQVIQVTPGGTATGPETGPGLAPEPERGQLDPDTDPLGDFAPGDIPFSFLPVNLAFTDLPPLPNPDLFSWADIGFIDDQFNMFGPDNPFDEFGQFEELDLGRFDQFRFEFEEEEPSTVIDMTNPIFDGSSRLDNLTVNGTIGNDTITTGFGNDTIHGMAGDDTIHAGFGNDTIFGGPGADVIYGEGGIDTVSYGAAVSAVNVNLSTGLATGGGGSDTLSGIEGVIGSDFADTLTGSSADELLHGGDGNDVIAGGGGADVLDGGYGDDTITYDSAALYIDGGDGNDTLSVSSSLDLTTLMLPSLNGLETIDLGSTGSLIVSASTVTALSSTSDTLFVNGNGASLTLSGIWTRGNNVVVNATTYHVLTNGDAMLKVASGVSYTLPSAPTIAMSQGLSFSTLQTDASSRSFGFHVYSADFDHDGDKDLLSVENWTHDLYYGSNDGAGNFTFSNVTSSGLYTSSYLAIGYFNNDTHLDVIAAGASVTSANTILLGDGAGGFTPLAQTDAGVTMANSTSMTTGDVDGDTDIDIVMVGAASKVLLNDGSGQFTVASTLTSTTGNDPVLIDLDKDTDLDLVVANWGAAYEVFLNNGSGAFTEIASWTNSAAQRQIDAFDMDGDGDLDVLAPNRGEQSAIYLNNGDGTATLAANRFSGTGITYGGGGGDLDGDGDLDVVAGMEGQTERIYRNNGTGNVTEITSITVDGNAVTGFGAVTTSDVVIDDFNNDGRNDVLIAAGGPGYVVYKNTTATTACAVTGVAVSPLAGLALADSDSAQLSGASVEISGGFVAGDTLAFTAASAISGSFDAVTHVLTLSGTDTVANYQAALQSLTFATAANSTTGLRTLSMTVTDVEGMTSATANTWIDAVNTDPLVLDLDLDGFDLMAATDAAFDIDADGDQEATGWVGAGDGLLAVDFDHSGTIDDGSELVSPFMELGDNATAPAGGSIDALASWDDNQDDRIDAADAIFADLKVWVDANADRNTQGGELLNMDAVGIRAFILDSFGPGSEVAGNTVLRTIGIEMTDGSIIQAGEVMFATAPASAQDDDNSYTIAPVADQLVSAVQAQAAL